MKTLTLLICGLLCCNVLFSQKIVDVTERTITVGSMKTEEIYFGFAAGDQVVFTFFEAEKKDLKKIEIVGYPSNSKFAVFDTDSVENETINVPTTGVYQFRFYNDSDSARECKIKIQRIPASEETATFNTNVAWQNEYDTSYYTVQEQYVKQEYVSQQIIPLTESYADSSSNTFPGGKSRLVFPVQLPENTVEWYYQVYAREDNQEKTTSSLNLAGELTTLIEQTGGLKFGLDLLTQLPGETYCDVYVMDQANATQFEAQNDYKYSLIGSSEHIKSAITKVHGGSSTPLYLGINNPNPENGVNIVLECVAIVLKEERGVRDVEKMDVSSKLVPVLKADDVSWVR